MPKADGCTKGRARCHISLIQDIHPSDASSHFVKAQSRQSTWAAQQHLVLPLPQPWAYFNVFCIEYLVPACTNEISCLLLVPKWSLVMRQENSIQISLPLAQKFWPVGSFCLSLSALDSTVRFCDCWGCLHVWHTKTTAPSGRRQQANQFYRF